MRVAVQGERAAAAPWAPSFFYAFAARLPTVLIEIPNSNAIIFCVMPRARQSSVAHSRLVSGRGCDVGRRLTSWGPPVGARGAPGRGRKHPNDATRRGVAIS